MLARKTRRLVQGTGSAACEAPVKHVYVGFVIDFSHIKRPAEMGPRVMRCR
jgi:hypothetical protein